MNVLFMTIGFPKAGEHSIYTDLMMEFVRNNHNVYVACSNEKRNRQRTRVSVEDGMNVLRIRTGNITGNINLIEKGISTLRIEGTFIKEIKNHFKNKSFDLILYSTPPITFARAVKYFKKRDHSITYLLLKDIFPQNAVDIRLLRKNSLLYRYFRWKEKKLYSFSDYIGCMSSANVDYLLNHNQEINREKVEICPNSITPAVINTSNKNDIKKKYNIPEGAITFIYGGNIGKPQGIDFILECLEQNLNKEDRFFIICGKGSEYEKIKAFFEDKAPANMLLIGGLPKKDYDELLTGCDIGMIFLDYRFTIPNFPSRLLSYMEYAMPVLACTDSNTDVGETIIAGNFGWWIKSNNSIAFQNVVDMVCDPSFDIIQYGSNARNYLEKYYSTNLSYEIINKHLS